MRVGALGAFSIANAGDVLLGEASRQAILRQRPDAQVTLFAPALASPGWRHDWRAVTPLPAGGVPDDVDALIIGGGIVNFAPEFRVFQPLAGPPAAWNAVCSQSTPFWAAPPEARDHLRRACERLRYVSVRNRTTEKLVRGCGFTGAVAVVPDPAISLDVPADDGLLARLGLAPDRFRIGLSLGVAVTDPRAAGFFATLFAGLRALQAGPLGAEVVLLPFGEIYRDSAFAEVAAAALPGARRLVGLDARDTWRLAGTLQVLVATRLHAVLAGVTQGVPLVILDEYLSDQTASSKLRDLVVDLDLEPSYTLPLISRSVEPRLGLAVELARSGAHPYRAALARARRALDEHETAMWEAVVA